MPIQRGSVAHCRSISAAAASGPGAVPFAAVPFAGEPLTAEPFFAELLRASSRRRLFTGYLQVCRPRVVSSGCLAGRPRTRDGPREVLRCFRYGGEGNMFTE